MIDLNYILALFVGFLLGFLGGGGSILTLPVLVYLFGIEPKIATAYSLFIVGISTLIISFKNIINKKVNLKISLIFTIFSVIGIFLSRNIILNLIPLEFEFYDFIISKSLLIMVFFSFVMLSSAISMLFIKPKNSGSEKNYIKIIVSSFIIGLIAGFVGAGGGFLIVPSLIFFASMDTHEAIKNSLIIIAVQSLLGFLISEIANFQSFDWRLIITFSLLSIIGIFVGALFSKKFNSDSLKKYFAYFIIATSIFILFKELI